MGQTCCRLSTNGNEYRSYDGEDVQVGGQGQAEDQHEGELRRTCSMDLLTPSPHALKCELEEMSFRFIDDTTEDVEDILNDTRKELECQANQEIQKFKTTAKRAADTVVDETKVKLSEATREEVKHFRNEVSSERHKSSKTSVTHVHGDQINIKNTGVVNISTPKGSKISIDNQKLIKDLKERLQQDYKKRLGSIPLSPLVPTINNKLYNFYVQPNISKPKPGTKGQHDDDDKSEVVVSYKDIFWSHNSKKKYADVYLQGEPGMGKSTFCAKLALDWCDAHSSAFAKGKNKSSQTEGFRDVETLKKFDYLFFIILRRTSSIKDVDEMIKEEIVKRIFSEKDHKIMYELIQTVLDENSCLIILEGLDEWSYSDHRIVPEKRMRKKCTILTTSRPWRMAKVAVAHSDIDAVLTISGIENAEVLAEKVIRCLNNISSQNKSAADFIQKLKQLNLSSFLQIPVVLMQLVCLWYENGSLKPSLREIYTNMIDMLFGRAIGLHIGIDNTKTIEKFEAKGKKKVTESLSKLAFHLLFKYNKANSIVFGEEIVDNHLSSAEKKVALKAGILSERESTQFLTSRKSDFIFLHKTFQEYLAAVYLAQNQHAVGEDIRLYFESSIEENVLDISQVFIFLCGMNPNIAELLSTWINSKIACKTQMKEFHAKTTFEAERPAHKLVDSLQTMMFSGYEEAIVNGYADVKLALSHYFFRKNQEDRLASSFAPLFDLNKHNIITFIHSSWLNYFSDSRLNEMFRLSGNTLTALDLRLMGGHLDLTPCRNLRCLYLAFFFEGSSVAIPTSSPRTLVLDNVTPEVEQSALSTLISNSSPLEKIIINKSNDVPFLCRAVESLSCLRYINLNAIDFGNEQISFPYTVTRVKLDYNAVCVDMLKHTIGRIKEAGKDHVVELVMFECTLLEPRTSSAKDLIKEIQKSRELSVSSIDISMEWPNPEDIINLELQTNSNQRCSELLLP
ncbi:uncharacterized protein LOC128222855 isoform X1 [Mya arenaria]|uniref:uncharacterized protein LOC128222855 isoform X1 n=1 Tax=Mya arenaria TaxID=6604 RepID=UPI0022E72746|nr:uncharacterized protein LOC128222855 isoform X1 [Mya arenaria]XP_052787964.1 uncharacterized protein LOC128222855 isoform X1 [Mya arenaria]